MKLKNASTGLLKTRIRMIQPDILVGRCDRPLQPGLKEKLPEFGDITPSDRAA